MHDVFLAALATEIKYVLTGDKLALTSKDIVSRLLLSCLCLLQRWGCQMMYIFSTRFCQTFSDFLQQAQNARVLR